MVTCCHPRSQSTQHPRRCIQGFLSCCPQILSYNIQQQQQKRKGNLDEQFEIIGNECFWSLLDGIFNLIISGLLLKSHSEINHRNINSGNTESHSCQLPIQCRQHFTNSLQKTTLFSSFSISKIYQTP